MAKRTSKDSNVSATSVFTGVPEVTNNKAIGIAVKDTSVELISESVIKKLKSVTVADIQDLVKNVSSDVAHGLYKGAKNLFSVTETVIKDDFKQRISAGGNNKLETTEGVITLVNKESTVLNDEAGLKDLLKAKSMSPELIYSKSYTLENKNPKVIEALLSKNVIAEHIALDSKKIAVFIAAYPEFEKFFTKTNSPYLKGL